jgi:hypothetical protein
MLKLEMNAEKAGETAMWEGVEAWLHLQRQD